MEVIPKQPKEKIGFSFSPELRGSDAKGESTVIDADHYLLLSNASVGTIYYTFKTNKYWANEGIEMDKALFESKFLPQLRWKFDVMVEEVIATERTDDKGKIKMVELKTGRKVSSYPPTPENIQAERNKLAQAAFNAGKLADLRAIWKATSPTTLVETDKFLSMIDETPFLQKLARRVSR